MSSIPRPSPSKPGFIIPVGKRSLNRDSEKLREQLEVTIRRQEELIKQLTKGINPSYKDLAESNEKLKSQNKHMANIIANLSLEKRQISNKLERLQIENKILFRNNAALIKENEELRNQKENRVPPILVDGELGL